MLVAQGKLDEALKAYRDSLAIRERLAAADRSNTEWQRDLSVSYDKVGDVLVAQGKLDEALKAYRDGLAIAERLAAADRSNTEWQRDLSVSYDRVGDVLVAQGKLDEALKAYRDSLAIRERLAAADRSNTRVAARSVGVVRQGRRRAGGAGQARRGAQGLPRQPRHRRAPRRRRSQQYRVAARSVGVVRQGRRRAGGAGQARRGAQGLPRWPRHPRAPRRRRSQQYASGSAICRCRTTGSATCWWRRASSTRRSRPTATASPSASASPPPIAAIRSGSAICRSRTTRSATCWWRRASSTRRSRPTATASPSASASPPPIAAIREWQRDLSVSYDKVGDVLVAQGKLDEALKAYRDSLAIAERLAATDRSNTQWQNDLQFSIGRIGDLAYRFVLARNFARALEASDQAISLAPDQIWLYTNRAHALMFLNRVDEARALYLHYRGEKNVQTGKSWETSVLEDFAELRKAGLTHPLMDEIEKRFAAGG